jgi:hypothetical protein
MSSSADTTLRSCSGVAATITSTLRNSFWRVIFDELVEHYRALTPLLA